jgi:BT1 family
MFAMLCPEGSEGLIYAVLTTIMNLSGTVASDIGSAFTLIWDVSNETISNSYQCFTIVSLDYGMVVTRFQRRTKKT